MSMSLNKRARLLDAILISGLFIILYTTCFLEYGEGWAVGLFYWIILMDFMLQFKQVLYEFYAVGVN